MADATASALGLTLPSRLPALEGLGAQLAEWRALLILDNCEHLIGACAVLAEHLLGACPGLRILATSREPLRVPGEVTWRVPSLALPDPERVGGARGAGRLRVDPPVLRARERRRGRLCVERGQRRGRWPRSASRLDGMPLALELAAARVGALSPAQIAERLGDCLAVLTAGSRSALDRQQTLRATLSWSHELLTIAERALFRRLAVFAGSFALEAAEQVTAGEGVERARSPTCWDDSSTSRWWWPRRRADGYRYRLLEPVRQYARERLVEAGEAATLEARHLAFYLEPRAGGRSRARGGRADRRARPARGRSRQPARGARVGAAARARAGVGAGRPHVADVDGRQPLPGGQPLAGGGAGGGARRPPRCAREALRAACGLRFRLGRTDGLSELGAERVAIFRALGDRGAVAHALDEVGVYEYMAGRYDRAERLYAQSRALAEELGDRKVLAAVRHSEGVLAQCRGDFAGAREALLDSLTRLRELPAGDGDRFFRVHTVGLFVAAEGPGGAPRMYFEETVAVLSPRGRRARGRLRPGRARRRRPRPGADRAGA